MDKYTWVELSSSYLPSEIVAAMLLAQLERIDAINADRLATWDFYHQSFAWLEAAGFVRRPVVPNDVVHIGHIYYLLLNSAQDRGAFIEAIRSAGVSTPFHYVPRHSSPAGRKLGRADGGLPVTDDIAERLVRLPLFYGIDKTATRVGPRR